MRSYLQHGRRHGPGGSDPIVPPPIFYDFNNVGDWLTVEATGFGGSGGEDPSEVNWGIVFISSGSGGFAVFDGLQSDPTVGGGIVLTEYGEGGILLEDGQAGFASGGLTLGEVGNGGLRIHNSGTGPLRIDDTGTPPGGIQLNSLFGFIELNSAAIDITGSVFIAGLPISDPGVPNQLWNNGGAINISP